MWTICEKFQVKIKKKIILTKIMRECLPQCTVHFILKKKIVSKQIRIQYIFHLDDVLNFLNVKWIDEISNEKVWGDQISSFEPQKILLPKNEKKNYDKNANNLKSTCHRSNLKIPLNSS